MTDTPDLGISTGNPSPDSLPRFDGTGFNMDEFVKLNDSVEEHSSKSEESGAAANILKETGATLSEGAEDEMFSDGDGVEAEVEEEIEALGEPTEDEDEVLEDSNVIKAKSGDEEIDIPEDAVIQVKVNGEVVEVTAKELASDYSGRAEISRRFTQLDKDRRHFQTQADSFEQQKARVNSHLELMSVLEPDEFIHHLAELQGQDPDEMFGNLVKKTVALVKQMQSVSPEQRHLVNENRKFRIEKKLQEVSRTINAQQEQHVQQTQQQSQRKEQVVGEMTSMHLTREDFVAAVNEVADYVKQEQSAGRNPGTFNEFDILDWAREGQILTTIKENVIKEVPNASVDYLKKVRLAIEAEEKYHGRFFTKKEIGTIVSRLTKRDRTVVKENLNKKAESLQAPKATSKKTRSPATNTAEVDDDQQLNDLMKALRY